MSQKTSKDEAAEFLRLTLPMMSKYQIPVTPANYAVWFDYTSGDPEIFGIYRWGWTP